MKNSQYGKNFQSKHTPARVCKEIVWTAALQALPGQILRWWYLREKHRVYLKSVGYSWENVIEFFFYLHGWTKTTRTIDNMIKNNDVKFMTMTVLIMNFTQVSFMKNVSPSENNLTTLPPLPPKRNIIHKLPSDNMPSPPPSQKFKAHVGLYSLDFFSVQFHHNRLCWV